MDNRACGTWGELPEKDLELEIPEFMTPEAAAMESAANCARFIVEAEKQSFHNHASEISRIRRKRSARNALLAAVVLLLFLLIAGAIAPCQ